MNNYYPLTVGLERFKRLENIAFELGRAQAQFDNPEILSDVIEARDENDDADRELSNKYKPF